MPRKRNAYEPFIGEIDLLNESPSEEPPSEGFQILYKKGLYEIYTTQIKVEKTKKTKIKKSRAKHGTVLEKSNWVNSNNNSPRYWILNKIKPNPNGKTFAVGTSQGEVSIFSTSEGGIKNRIATTAKNIFKKSHFEITALEYSPSGKYLTALSTTSRSSYDIVNDCVISVYDVSDLSRGLQLLYEKDVKIRHDTGIPIGISFISDKLIVGFFGKEFFCWKLTNNILRDYQRMNFASDIVDVKRHDNTIIFLLKNGSIGELRNDNLSIINDGNGINTENSYWGVEYYAKHGNIVLASMFKFLYMCDLSAPVKGWLRLDEKINEKETTRLEFTPDGTYIIANKRGKISMYPFIENKTLGKETKIASGIWYGIDFMGYSAIPTNEAETLRVNPLNVNLRLRF